MKVFSSTFRVSVDADYDGLDILQMISEKRKVFNELQKKLSENNETSYHGGRIQRLCLECKSPMFSGFWKFEDKISENSKCSVRCGYNEFIVYDLISAQVEYKSWFDDEESKQYEETIDKQKELNYGISNKIMEHCIEVEKVNLNEEDKNFIEDCDLSDLFD